MRCADMRDAWNRIAPHYQDEHKIPTEFVHWGPHCPNEDHLKLMGDVRGKRVLEIGCGGGQNTIAVARRGAIATGIDLSDEQVKFARGLAKQEGVETTFLRRNVEKLSPIADASQDVVFSARALEFVERMDRCLCEVARVLRPGGVLVFSIEHPFWYCLADGDMRVESSYFEGPHSYQWVQTGLRPRPSVYEYHRSVGEWHHLLREAGLQVLDIVEPEPVESGSGQDWRGYYDPERQRMVPANMIWRAAKPKRGR